MSEQWLGVFDGACRQNPGPAGSGAALLCDGQVVWSGTKFLGVSTNNVAEWTGLELLVDEIERRGLTGVVIQGDSQLVVHQAQGQWKINNANLAQIAARVQPKIQALNLHLKWVRREENKLADQLSNQAIDQPQSTSASEMIDDLKLVRQGDRWLLVDGTLCYEVDLKNRRLHVKGDVG